MTSRPGGNDTKIQFNDNKVSENADISTLKLSNYNLMGKKETTSKEQKNTSKVQMYGSVGSEKKILKKLAFFTGGRY